MTLMVKDPGTRIDFEFDWSAAYPDGQAVVDSDWAILPDEPLRGAADRWTIAAARVVRTRFAVTREGGWRHEVVVRCRCLEG